MHHYSSITEVDELMSTAVEKGLVPAMRDERKTFSVVAPCDFSNN